MKTKSAYLFAVLAIPLTLGLAAVADDVSFHPAKDVKSQKELRIEGEFRVKEAAFTVNGEPMPGEMLEQITSQEMLLSIAIDATETFLATKDGSPTDLLRSYDKMETKVEIGDQSESPKKANELEGKVVRFQWDDKASEFKKSFHESKGDDALLEQLIDDMEVRAMLPAKKVAQGDTWEVDAEHMTALFFPGGIAGGADDSAGEGPDMDAMGKEMAKQMEEAFKEFKVACTYKGARDAAGTRVGEIAFTYDGKASLDLDSILRQVQDAFGGEGAPQMEFTTSATLSLKGDGVLLWDLATGVLHSYEMKSNLGLDVSIQVHAEQDGQQFEVSLSGSLGGDVTWELARK
ncbi:MAG: hypothetical protein NTY35_10760 [Planctomycetota bacterium]|nr:hypothetical protein [Planctomycetota bacterium]